MKRLPFLLVLLVLAAAPARADGPATNAAPVGVSPEALRDLGANHALVVHGQDGLDEISCCDSTRITELKDGEIRSYEFFPQLLTGASYAPEEIAGGTPEENAAITRRILSGEEQGAPRAVVLLNAAAAIYVAGLAESIDGGVKLAAESIDSGAAQAKLEALVEASL